MRRALTLTGLALAGTALGAAVYTTQVPATGGNVPTASATVQPVQPVQQTRPVQQTQPVQQAQPVDDNGGIGNGSREGDDGDNWDDSWDDNGGDDD